MRIVFASFAGSVLLAGFVFAAVNVYSAQEGEAGSRAGSVSLIADTSASGSSAIKFG